MDQENDLKKNFIDKLRYQLKIHRLKQKELASIIEVHPSTLNGWLSRGIYDKSKLPALARVFGTSIDYWVGMSPIDAEVSKAISTDLNDMSSQNRVWLTLHGNVHVSAGNGELVWDEDETSKVAFDQNYFTEELKRNPDHCKLLIVKGDSMEPFIFDGDTIMIDVSDNTVFDHKIYVVYFEGEVFVKRLVKQGDGSILLQSFNSYYNDKTVNIYRDNVRFKVIGRVIYRAGKSRI